MLSKPNLKSIFSAAWPYLLSPVLVTIVTIFLQFLQTNEQVNISGTAAARPFTVGFVIPIALITAFGGLPAGLFTLGLALLATVRSLMWPGDGDLTVEMMRRDLVELVALLSVGTIVIIAIHSTRRARAQAEVALESSRETETRLKAIMDTAPTGVIACDKDGVLEYANPEAERIWGRTLERVGREGWANYGVRYLDGTPVPVEEMGMGVAMREGHSPGRDLLVAGPNGTTLPVFTASTALRDAAGNITGALAVMTDISERRRAEVERENALDALQRSEERLGNVIANAPVVVFAIDCDGVFNFSDGKGLERLGLRPGEAVGRSIYELYADYPWVIAEVERALKGEMISWSSEIGGIVFDTQCTPLHDDKDNIIGIIGVSLDVTTQHETQTQLIRNEERFRSLVTATTQIVWSANKEGRADYLPQWLEFTGQAQEEAEGFGWTNAVHSDDIPNTIALWEKAQRTLGIFDVEYRIRRHDGEYRHFAVRGVPVLEADGSLREWIGVCDDIHDRKVAEAACNTLLDEAVARAKQEATINQLGQLQRSLDDPLQVQRVAADVLGRQLNADRCFIFTYDAVQGTAQVDTDWRRGPLLSIVGTYQIPEYGLDFDEMFRNGRTAVLNSAEDWTNSEDGRARLRALGIEAAILVPVFEAGALTSVLAVTMATQTREWMREEIELVEAVASQTRTTTDLARARAHDRKVAELLQNALTPRAPEAVPGLDLAYHYKAALEEANVGGDFFDVFAIEKGANVLVIGDLSGKGLAAASQVATVRNMLRYAVYRNRTLADAMAELNDTMAEHDLLTGFVTLFACVHEASSNRLTYVSCGHEPILLSRSRENWSVQELDSTGPVLGAFAGATYEEGVVSLASEDVLLLYTDGISEAGRSRHDFLGSDGLGKLLGDVCREMSPPRPANAIVQQIIRGVDTYNDGASHDDRCVLLARVRGNESGTTAAALR